MVLGQSRSGVRVQFTLVSPQSFPLILALLLEAVSAHAAPFPSTDQNPLLGGLTLTAPARLDSAKTQSADLNFFWSSTAVVQQASNQTLIVDAESREWRLQWQRALTDSVSVRVDIPYRSISGGSLDGSIERWHDVFGLPNGNRDSLPRNDLRIDYRRDTRPQLNYPYGHYAGFGDILLSAGWQWSASPNRATSIWSTLSLPTGQASKLTGTDAFAGTLLLAQTFTAGRYFELFGHVGVHLSAQAEPLASERRSTMWMAMVGGDLHATDNFDITVQIDAHSAAFDNEGLALLGEVYTLTVGGDYQLTPGWRLRFGVIEDIKVEASPDITFVMSVGKKW